MKDLLGSINSIEEINLSHCQNLTDVTFKAILKKVF